ncbi:MAG: hypothetical protein HYY37_05330 [Candidatus Aenigmarchaeota archaeon]|nr:hypothetical protein [Candidatus Aenigmarchaeota archaeon]
MGEYIEIRSTHVLLAIAGIALLVAGYALISSLSTLSLQQKSDKEAATMPPKISRMDLSPFDRALARQIMDKNGDGKCDACGMPVDMCIDSGQLQCNMDPSSTIGLLGSQHIHADWKIYINGKALDDKFFDSISMDMSNTNNGISSSFIHVDKGAPSPEKTGDLIHMHATGVPLWIFFKSVGMDFSKDCVTLPDGQKFCSDNKNVLKFYVNGKPNNEWENYVFSDLDKVLISYGDETDLTIQLNSITDFAKNH